MKTNSFKIDNQVRHFFGRKVSAFLILIFLSINLFAAQRTWTGSISTNWSTAGNWSGGVAPASTDTVTISASTFNCVLDSNRSINQLTISDSLDLNGLTLTVTGNSTFNSGAYITNGTLTIYLASSSSTFTSGTISATLNVTASTIKFSGTTFTAPVVAVKKGSSSSTGDGGSTFSSTVTLIDSSSGNWTFANSTADTWNDRVEVKEVSSGTIFFANTATGNSFSKSVTFTNTSSGTIHCDQSGTSTFHDSIIVNASSTGSIKFGSSETQLVQEVVIAVMFTVQLRKQEMILFSLHLEILRNIAIHTILYILHLLPQL